MSRHISEAELKRRMAKIGGFVEKTKKSGGSTIPPDDKVKKPAQTKKPKKSPDKPQDRGFFQNLRDRFQTKKLKQIERATGQSTEDLRRGFKTRP